MNLPSQMDVEISDAVSTGAMEAIGDSIADAKNYVKTATAGSFPDLIRSWDNTYPTDNNVFSARRTLKEALSRLREDTAQEKLHFLKGADFGRYKAGESGAGVDGDGNAEWLTVVIRELLRSVKFVDGMTGEGWQLWMDALTGLSNLTIDKVTIRQTLVALELLIQKVRSIGGQFVVSAASGKIKAVTKDGDNYKITFEQENEFTAHDLMRCAEFTGTSLRGYWVEISASDGEGVTVPVSEFGGVEPKAGDECVLMGNTQNRLRQNLISIAATEDGQPRVDVLDGVSAKSFDGCLRVRLGNLDGISDSRFPADNQPHGNGLYGDNVYLMGTFVLTTGEDILTRFEITEGRIEAAVEGLRKDFTEDRSYLDNASFGDGMNKWDTENAHHRIYTQQIHPAEKRKLPLHPDVQRGERRGTEEAGGGVPEFFLPRGQDRTADHQVRGAGQDRLRELQRVRLRRRAGGDGRLPGVQPQRAVERYGRL